MSDTFKTCQIIHLKWSNTSKQSDTFSCIWLLLMNNSSTVLCLHLKYLFGKYTSCYTYKHTCIHKVGATNVVSEQMINAFLKFYMFESWMTFGDTTAKFRPNNRRPDNKFCNIRIQTLEPPLVNCKSVFLMLILLQKLGLGCVCSRSFQ